MSEGDSPYEHRGQSENGAKSTKQLLIGSVTDGETGSGIPSGDERAAPTGGPLPDYDDLRLLKAVMKHRRLKAAAAEAGVSVPTASRGLARLRVLTGDPLFIRTKEGLVPTARMESLAPKVDVLLTTLDAFREETTFEPETARRTIRVTSADNGVCAYIAPAIPELHAEAPYVTLVVLPLKGDVFEALRNDETDLVIFPFPEKSIPAECRSLALPPVRLKLLVRKGHPLLKLRGKKGKVTREDAARYPTVVANPNIALQPEAAIAEARAACDDAFLFMPYFTAAPAILEKGDFVLWCASASVRFLTRTGAFELVETEDAPVFTPRLIWHRRLHADPLHQWLRGMILHHAQNAGEKRSCAVD